MKIWPAEAAPDGRAPGTHRVVPHIVGIGGTTRPGSGTETALRFVLAEAAAQGASTELFGWPLLDLPHYDVTSHDRTPAVRRLVAAMRRADGIVIASPGYHGGVSGLVKTALDYAEDLRDDARPYFDGRAVGLIVTAAGEQALGSTLAALRSIVHALRGWPTPLGVTLGPAASRIEDGVPADPAARARLSELAAQVLRFAAAARG